MTKTIVVNQPIIDALLPQLAAVQAEIDTIDHEKLKNLIAERTKFKRTLESYGWVDPEKAAKAAKEAEAKEAAETAADVSTEPETVEQSAE